MIASFVEKFNQLVKLSFHYRCASTPMDRQNLRHRCQYPHRDIRRRPFRRWLRPRHKRVRHGTQTDLITVSSRISDLWNELHNKRATYYTFPNEITGSFSIVSVYSIRLKCRHFAPVVKKINILHTLWKFPLDSTLIALNYEPNS